MLTQLKSKKLKGMSTYAASIFCIFFLCVFFLTLFYVFSQLIYENNVERAYRKYLLYMEREGCLTDEKADDLVDELTALGVTNIKLDGTSRTPVGYGNEVHLHIKGDLKVDSIKTVGGKFVAQKETIHIDIEKTGTALY